MINKNHVIAILVAVVFIDEVIISKINRRRFARNQSQLSDALDRNIYFAKMLDDNDIPMTEFDQIAINALYN